MPLPVEAIQVDGGSEFKAEFEQACQANEQLLVFGRTRNAALY